MYLLKVLAAGRESPVVIVFSPLNIIQKDQLESLKRLGITACRLNQSGKVDGSTDTTQFPVDLM
jgi:superfamily II DNA helicase RecQ